MRLITVLVLCLAGSSNGLVNNENLIVMHPQTVRDFATAFNKSLAIIVSTAYRNAVKIANELEQLNTQCRNAIESANDQCSRSVQNVCGNSVEIPSFKLVDPFVCAASIGLANPDMCPALVLGFTTEVITRILKNVANVVDKLGDEASEFLNNVKEALDNAGDAVREAISSSLDGLADGIDHVVNEIGDIGDDLIDGIGDIGGDLVDGIGDIGGDLVDGIGDIGGDLIDGIGDIGGDLIDGIGDIGGDLIDGIGDVGGDIVDGIGDIGGNLVDGIGDVISNTRISIRTPRVRLGRWGKKRRKRTIDEETRECMEICDPCDPFLQDTSEETAIAICGLELMNRNKAFKRMTERISNVVSGIFNATNPIISEILYDPTSMNNLFQLTHVVMVARLNGGIEYYRSEVPFSMMNIAETATLMAEEYWGKTNDN